MTAREVDEDGRWKSRAMAKAT